MAEGVPVEQHLARLGAIAAADPQIDRTAGADWIAAHCEQDRGRRHEKQEGDQPGAARHEFDASRALSLAKPHGCDDQRVMLRTYGPGCEGDLIEATVAKIPDSATWVDLEEPTKEEEELVERCIKMDVPTESEMSEIEPSSRLYERDGALYMTVSVLYGVQEGQPRTAPISFVLTDNRLVTVRYATPKPVRAFSEHARRDPGLVKDAPTALIRLLDAIVDRLADEIENVSATMEDLSQKIFTQSEQERRIPVHTLTSLLTRIGL